MQTSIRHLKDHLSEYIHLVQKGTEVIVTSHNKPIARLLPITESADQKTSRKKLREDLVLLHQQLKNSRIKEPLSKAIIKNRERERY